MRSLADENVPADAITILRGSGLDVASATDTLAGADDETVLGLAQVEGRILVTFDKDFAELVFHRHRRATAGPVLLRTRPRSPQFVAEVLISLLKGGQPLEGHFTVVTDRHIRTVPFL